MSDIKGKQNVCKEKNLEEEELWGPESDEEAVVVRIKSFREIDLADPKFQTIFESVELLIKAITSRHLNLDKPSRHLNLDKPSTSFSTSQYLGKPYRHPSRHLNLHKPSRHPSQHPNLDKPSRHPSRHPNLDKP
jgi:hypothetical protein